MVSQSNHSAADSLLYGEDEAYDPSLGQSSRRIFFWIKNFLGKLLAAELALGSQASSS